MSDLKLVWALKCSQGSQNRSWEQKSMLPEAGTGPISASLSVGTRSHRPIRKISQSSQPALICDNNPLFSKGLGETFESKQPGILWLSLAG